MWFVVDEEEKLRGVYEHLADAELTSGPHDEIIAVNNDDLHKLRLEFVYFPVDSDYGDPAIVEHLEIHDAEIEDIQERLANLELDTYGEVQESISVELDPNLELEDEEEEEEDGWNPYGEPPDGLS